MLDETKFSDPEIDEGMRMPSGKVFLALAALGRFPPEIGHALRVGRTADGVG